MASVEREFEWMKGNHAMCFGAIRAGARAYYGYPITPQNEATEYMALHMPRAGGTSSATVSRFTFEGSTED